MCFPVFSKPNESKLPEASKLDGQGDDNKEPLAEASRASALEDVKAMEVPKRVEKAWKKSIVHLFHRLFQVFSDSFYQDLFLFE